MGYIPSDTNLALALALEGASTGHADIRRLVGVARLLESVPDPDINPGFAARLEARLMTEDLGLVHAIRPTPRPDEPTDLPEAEHRAAIIRFPRRRLVIRKALAFTIAAMLALALPVVSMAAAIPGSPGYGLKLRIEALRVAAANGPIGKGFVWLDIAGNRLGEAQQLAAIDRPKMIPLTLDRLERAQRMGATLILGAATDRGILARVAGVLQSQGAGLNELLGDVPLGTQDDVLDAIRTGQALSLRVAAALGLPMIRPPATVSPGAAAPDQTSIDPSVSSDDAWDTMKSGNGATTAGKRVATGRDGDDSDASYACSSDLAQHPDAAGADSTACRMSVSMTDPNDDVDELVSFIDHATALPSEKANPAPSGACPSPQTCRMHELKPYRWPTTNGIAMVQFDLNPTGSGLSTAQARDSVQAAMKVWTAASPNVRFSNLRITSREPDSTDVHNVIGWAPLAPKLLAIASVHRRGSRIVNADITFNSLMPWSWTPCAQRNNSCTKAGGGALLGRFDVQAIATHELGHTLGLAHLVDPDRPESADPARELSMYAQPHPGERKQATLALGDVLAIRAAYPYKGRSAPPVYAP